jgi:hypothetical protein
MVSDQEREEFVRHRAEELLQFAQISYPNLIEKHRHADDLPELTPGSPIGLFLETLYSEVLKKKTLTSSQADCFTRAVDSLFPTSPRLQETFYDYMCASYAGGFSELREDEIKTDRRFDQSDYKNWGARHEDGSKIIFHYEEYGREGDFDWRANVEWKSQIYEVSSGGAIHGDISTKVPPDSKLYRVRHDIAFRVNSAHYFCKGGKELSRFCQR